MSMATIIRLHVLPNGTLIVYWSDGTQTIGLR
jgi:hypothetical protein